MDVHYYVTKAGRNEVDEWIAELANNRTEARILARIELRIDFGPGYQNLLRDDRSCLRVTALRRGQKEAVLRH